MMARALCLVGLCCWVVQAREAPTVDLAHWRTGDRLLQDAVARQLSIAAREFGFFYVSNHGVAADITKQAEEAMLEFFDLPHEEKQKIEADKSRALKTARGYAGFRREQLDVSNNGRPDLKEVLDLGLPLGESTETYLGPNPWPTPMPQLRNATEPYLRASLSLGLELLGVVARSLGLADESFSEVFEEPLVVQRLMRYPARDDIDDALPEDLGCGAHYDFGGLTLLRQTDAAGLQVQPPVHRDTSPERVTIDSVPYTTMQGTFYSDLKNDHANEWLSVDTRPDLMTVTFGEALQRLTNGRIQATRHRVVHDGPTARHSMAVFVDPNPHMEVAPLAELAGKGPRYPARIAGHKTVLLAAALAARGHGTSDKLGGYLGFGRV